MVSVAMKKFGAVLLAVWLVIMLYILLADVFGTKPAETQSGLSKVLKNEQQEHPRHDIKPQSTPKQMVPPIHVCLSSDADDVIGVVTAMNSVWSNSRHPIFFHLLVTAEAKELLSTWLSSKSFFGIAYEVVVFDESRIAADIKIHGGREDLAKPMNYARYFYAEMFPNMHGKVIHLDADVIVQGDIYDLLETKLDPEHTIAVSEDCTGMNKRFTQMENTLNKYINFNSPSVKAAKLNPMGCSFNIGVYVFDVDKWRAGNITQQLMTWVKLNAKEDIYGSLQGGGGSGPPMMIVMHHKYSRIDPMWHVRHLGHTTSSKVYSAAVISHAKLLHWNGHFKPWQGVAQQQKIWDKYYVPDPSGKIHPVRKIPVRKS